MTARSASAEPKGAREPLFAFFGGGTGGHVTPALAVAAALRAAAGPCGVRCILFTSGRWGERCLTRDPEIDFRDLALARPRRLPLRFAGQSLSRFEQICRFFLAHKPRACFGMGGYLALPGTLAARACSVPVILLEQNRVPGRVNRLVAPLADLACTSFPDLRPALRSRRVVFTGNPVRAEFVASRRSLAERPARSCRTVAVLGGSQGAQSINRAVCQALDRLGPARERLRFVHAAGPDVEAVAAAYGRAGVAADVAPFFEHLAARIAGADLAISRAGGSTIAELLTLGIPSVLVPYPHARDGHQESNARYVAEHGAGSVVSQQELDPAAIAALLRDLVFDPARWDRAARAAFALGRPAAADAIARLALAGSRTTGRVARGVNP